MTEMKRRVDVHHHFLPPYYRDAKRDVIAAFMPGFERTLDWTPQWSLEAMDKADVQTSVLSQSVPGLWFGDRDEARRLARETNIYGARLCADHPGRFGIFAALPLPDVEGSLIEIEFAFDELHADGIGLLSSNGGKWLGDISYAPIYEELNRRSAVVYVHPTAPECCQGLIPDVPPSAIEFPFDTTRAIVSLLYSGTLSRYPNVRFIFSHGGGAFPMVAARFSAIAMGRKAVADRLPSGAAFELSKLYFDTAFITNPASYAALSHCVESSHLLFGTDYPFGHLDRSLEALRSLGISAEDLEGIEGGNALQLLPLKRATADAPR